MGYRSDLWVLDWVPEMPFLDLEGLKKELEKLVGRDWVDIAEKPLCVGVRSVKVYRGFEKRFFEIVQKYLKAEAVLRFECRGEGKLDMCAYLVSKEQWEKFAYVLDLREMKGDYSPLV